MTEATKHNLAVAKAIGIDVILGDDGYYALSLEGKQCGYIGSVRPSYAGTMFNPWGDVNQALDAADRMFGKDYDIRRAADHFKVKYWPEFPREPNDNAPIFGEARSKLSEAICSAIEKASMEENDD